MAKIELKTVRRFSTRRKFQRIDLCDRGRRVHRADRPLRLRKSTLLRVRVSSRRHQAKYASGTSVDGVRPSGRNLAMVFQSYALYPHLTVFDNIAVPLRMRRHSAPARTPRSAGSCPDAPAPNAGSARRSSGLPLSSNFQVCSGASRDNCRAASGSALRSDAPSCVSRSGFCSTSRCPTWTPSCAFICAPNSPSYIASCKPPLST